MFFLALLVYQIGFPAAAYALTSGPTAPEATSFEPVDTTDMVNLQTGDFTYNLPLLEVPGPEGGYPLSLSYHAGIQVGEDASWTGLGWTLNPGAITRNVNGYPDDWFSETQLRRDYWEGGQTNTYNVGVSVGIANTPATVSFGLAFSQDTYQGFGVGGSVGVGANYGPLHIGAEVGVTPFGQSYQSIGFSASTSSGGSLGVSVSGGLSTSGGYAGVSAGNSFLGASMGTNGLSMIVGEGITGTTNNDRSGEISTKSSGLSVDIPIGYVNIRLGYNHTRYWSDENVNIPAHGSLNLTGWNMLDNHAYDCYSLLNYDPANYNATNIVDNSDPDVLQGGTFPDYDNYVVTAQGLAGTMRPYGFQNYVARQNRSNSNRTTIMYVCPGQTNTFNMLGKQPQFRFDNDFSNQYRQNFNDIDVVNVYAMNLPAPFDPNPVYGNNDGTYGYNTATTQLAGSRSIRTIDYATLFGASDKKGFLYPSGTTGFVYNSALAKSIGGFAVTNSSGVTYHYSLPAYSYNESIYSEKIDPSKGPGQSKSFNRQVKPGKYAYTWYLTGVTGPDYVDKNNNGILDEGDWGYWVKFEYGKWTDTYCWRNPETGFAPDIDNKFQNASKGQKEVYYLNAIKTRSHTALFVKDLRTDARGASPTIMQSTGDTESVGAYDGNSAYSLSLNRILLYNNADLPALNMNSSSELNIAAHYAGNVLDKYDVADPSFLQKAFRVIDFKYDLSLCFYTPNSFSGSSTRVTAGKLTLNQLVVRGKGGACMLPSTDFQYEVDDTNMGTITASTAPGSNSIGNITCSNIANGQYNVGDILNIYIGRGRYSGVITKKYSATSYDVKYFPGMASGGGSGTCYITKNPIYLQDAKDIWGLYKSDYDAAAYAQNSNIGGARTYASAGSADAWSLRKITTQLGAKIRVEYESDVYNKAVLNSSSSSVINNFSYNSTTKQLSFKVNSIGDGLSLSNTYKVGTKLNALLIQPADITIQSKNSDGSSWPLTILDGDQYVTRTAILGGNEFVITAVDDVNKTITVNCSTLNELNIPNTVPNTDVIKVECKVYSTGNLFYSNDFNRPGGGLRVKTLSVQSTQNTATTMYDYSNADNPAISSGVTSYEPSVFDYCEVSRYPAVASGENQYKKELYKNINYLLTIAREVTPPGVVYKNVSVRTKVTSPDGTERATAGRTVYEFEVFNENMISRHKVGLGTTSGYYHNNPSSGSLNVGNNQTIQNLTAAVGLLKRTTTYDVNDKPLASTNYMFEHGTFGSPNPAFLDIYYNGLNKYNYQGVTSERSFEEKYVYNPATSQNKVMLTMSAKETYPVIPTGVTTTDYKTGTSTAKYYNGYDFYSGEITKTVTRDIYGNAFATEVIPAYRKYPQMGLMVNNSANKNMLTQTAGSYTYVLGNGVNAGVVSASATIWGNQTPVLNPDNSGTTLVQNTSSVGNVWRKQQEYIWRPDVIKPDGVVPMAEFTDINWTNPLASNSAWKKAVEVTLYSANSHPLETVDINGAYGATKYGYKDSRKVLTVTPAQYSQVAFSGAEDELIGSAFSSGVNPGDGTIETSTTFPATLAHTGYNSLRTAAAKQGFNYTVPVAASQLNVQYQASVWVKSVAGGQPSANIYYQVNGGTPTPATVTATRKSGDWYLLTLVTPTSASASAGSSIKFGCTNTGATDVVFDDFRVHPVSASSTAFVYDKTSGELTYILDNKNIYTRYNYDSGGKLIGTYKEIIGTGEKKVYEYEYNYGKGCIAANNLSIPKVDFYKQHFGLI
ncbi:hypothetical protein DF182_12420 [Chitinophaga flava]|uniref:Uncharacterized protein n=2 Tax=Chitinophaga flava TaxID=2259036 RepID=A0A365Y5P7_9BACT|nr:hypothetical protein DF182_12420 [Chitinophaga flava]